MADYISREECIKDLREYEKTAFSGLTVIGCMSRIKRIPAADVRPVVLCRDCRWWTKQEKSLQGRCELGGFYPTGGWFCANGKRHNCGVDMREEDADG